MKAESFDRKDFGARLSMRPDSWSPKNLLRESRKIFIWISITLCALTLIFFSAKSDGELSRISFGQVDRSFHAKVPLQMSGPAEPMGWQAPPGKIVLGSAFMLSLIVCYLGFCLVISRLMLERAKEDGKFFGDLPEALTTLTYVFDVEQQLLKYCNRHGARMIGLPNSHNINVPSSILHQFGGKGDFESPSAHLARLAALPDGESLKFEQQILGADGIMRWILHEECIHSRNPDGSCRTVVGVGHDITEHRNAENLIRENAELLEQVIDQAANGISLVSPKGHFLRVNNALCDLLGYSSYELLHMRVQTITHPRDLEEDWLLRSSMLTGSPRTSQIEQRYIRKDGKTIWVSLNMSLICDHLQKPLYFVSQILDISDRRASGIQLQKDALILAAKNEELVTANEKLEAMATTDGLTGLSNRRRFDEEFSQLFSSARRYGTPLSLLVLDIDHFKSVNDRFGHVFGDTVLCKVASLLKKGARDSDIVARYGGEEFAIICSQTDLVAATILAGRLRRDIAATAFECGPITASFGIAALSSADKVVKDLIHRADGALYQSKEQGRNRVTIWKSEWKLAA